jgi:non-specific serine/threonine protein kinase
MSGTIDTIALSPHGSLYLLPTADAASLPDRVVAAFAKGHAPGLMQLGLSELATELPPDLAYWRDFAALYFARLAAIPELADGGQPAVVELPAPTDALARHAADAPPLVGGEYLSAEVLQHLWNDVHRAVQDALAQHAGGIRGLFERHGSAWNLVGRVYFHLAENRSDEERPFAFLATYTHRLSAKGKAQHLPLGRALKEYAGEKNRAQLLQLLLPVHKGAEAIPLLKELVDSGEIFHPLAWTPDDALAFLRQVPSFEAAGIMVRIPNWWKSRKPPRPMVSVTVGGKETALLGMDSLLDFRAELTLDGERLTKKEAEEILASASGLALIRGRWVEVDRDKLQAVLEHWKSVERSVAHDGLSFIDGMRLLSDAAIGGRAADLLADDASDWTEVKAGEGLAQVLERLRDPGTAAGSIARNDADPGESLRATLRPYQRAGVAWLRFLNRLGVGGCLADDMGLGKTIQVIALLLLLKREQANERRPSLLVVPASLIGNWKSELDRFAPALRYRIAHPSAQADGLRGNEPPGAEALASIDAVITTYGYLTRLAWVAATEWRCIVIDEAQAIRNSGTRQARAVKALSGQHRIALTGTPVENRLSDLWSLYDFLIPGLLGTGREFAEFVKGAQKEGRQNRYAALRNLVRPYLLRRMKTDRRIIDDLPDKTEVAAWCTLSKTQAVLYRQSVKELADRIRNAEGIERKGLVLSYLMRLKQICNHPSQWLGDERYAPADSGKFGRLAEIAEEIAARQQKVLVFTQFREMTEPLANFLEGVFGQPGLVLHGETPVAKRRALVEAFADERKAPFFVLSLRAGGTGLNLTAASHVIHFDRWWNPAVENQATDRAYRIGQRNNVLVHKFVCRGTVEEKIDALIAEKQRLSAEILEGGQEALLTELPDDELLKLVALDLRSASAE